MSIRYAVGVLMIGCSLLSFAAAELSTPSAGKPAVDAARGATSSEARLITATINHGAVTVPDGGTILIGQVLVGTASSADHRMRFGSIDALYAPAFGDFNEDKVVSPADYPDFYRCLGGPGVTVPPGCGRGDGDEDFDADLEDLAKYLRTAAATP